MKRFLTGIICALTVAGASASDFFSTEKSEELFTFGARIGVNTTNRTISGSAFPGCYNHESWGTGFDAGVVASIHFRDYLAIQPGFFFESRSNSYTLMGSPAGTVYHDSEIAQAGRHNSYNFTIPVMAIIGFNVSDEVRWNVEAGPYVAFVLNSKLSNKYFVVDGDFSEPLFRQKAAGVDFGFKLGTAFQIYDHYYIGAHYMAGCLGAWKDLKFDTYKKDFGGVTKGWVFSIGYEF